MLALGDVEDLGDEVHRRTVRLAQQGHREVAPQRAAVGAVVALAEPVGVADPRERLLHELEVVGEVVGVGDVLEGHPQQGRLVVPEHRAQRVVGGQEAAVGRDQRHAHRGVLHGELPQRGRPEIAAHRRLPCVRASPTSPTAAA